MAMALCGRVAAQCIGGEAQCHILIEMHDSYGDGWNNGHLYVYQDTMLRGDVTLADGSSGETQVAVCSDTIVFVWSSGWYDGEITFVVTNEDGDTLLAMADASVYTTGDTIAVVMHQCSTCPRPSGLQVVARSHNQLQLAWLGGSGTWQVEYGEEGFTPGSGYTLTVTTPMVMLTGLDSARRYDVYVTAVCAGETSMPRKGTFVTLCGENTCDMMFELRDYNWDGWQGNRIELYQRGSLMDFVTLEEGGFATINVPMCHDSVTLVWRRANYDYDAYFEVHDISGRLLASGDNYDYYEGDTIGTVMNNCVPCPYPEWVATSHVDTSHATFVWPSTGAAGYVLKLYDDGGLLLTTVSTTDTFYTFSALQSMRDYGVLVASICGTDTSGWNEGWCTTHAVWTPIIYVSTIGDDYANSGSSWSDAFASPYAGASRASLLRDQYGTTPEVWVAEGYYNSSIPISPGLHVYGGLAGNEVAGYDMGQRDLVAHPTVLNNNGSQVVYQNYTLTDSTMAWVDGFTFTGGTGRVAYLSDFAQLRNCTLTGNTSSYPLVRAQCYINDPNKPASLLNCKIVDNNCNSSSLVELINARAVNCLLARNSAYYHVVIMYDSSMLSHCDVVANNSQYYYAVAGSSYNNNSYSRLENTIVWGNTRGGSSGDGYQMTGMLVADHSAIQGGYSGTGNVNLSDQNEGSSLSAQYPIFADAAYDFRLGEGSACIDAAGGTPTMSTDLAGHPRVYGTAADIGCYEWQGESICSAVTSAQVSEVTSYSAQVEWRAPRANYMLYYAPQGSTTWDSIPVDAEALGDTTGSVRFCHVALGGLAALTEYVVRLHTVCTDGVSEAYELTFTTTCPDHVGYVTIGDTTANITTQGNYLPTQTYYNYSATQQIYLASEMGAENTISQLDFFYTYSSPVTRRLKIYLGHTTMDVFSSSSDVIPESQLTLVWGGEYTFSNTPRMNSIQLQTPFHYNGTDNLVLAVIDSTGSWVYSANKFLTFSAPNRSLYYYRDGSYVNFSNVTLNVGSYCNVLHLPGQCDTAACPIPRYTVQPDVTTAQVDWVVSGTAEVECRQTGASTFTAAPAGSTVISSPGVGTTTLTGLLPYREYEVRVRNICGAGDSSRWLSRTFTTLPYNVQRLYVKPLAGGDGSGTSWADAMGDLNEALRMADACYLVYGTLCDIWVAEGTYHGDTTGNYAVGMVPGVRLYGGLMGNETENFDMNQRDLTAHRTILDGGGLRQVVSLGTSSFRGRNAALDGVTIQNGYTQNDGGGVYGYYLDLNRSVIRNCVSDAGYGGGAYILYGALSNCLIYGNSSYRAGGVYAYYSNIDHCDIVGNQSDYYAGIYTYYGTMANTILWGNRPTSGSADEAYVYGTTITHSAADVALGGDSTVLLLAHAGTPAPTSGSSGDSLYVRFASPDDHDYRLMEGSACIDRGTTTNASPYDLGGQVRPYGAAPDMGCYEYHGERYCLRPVQLHVSNVNSFSALIGWVSERDTVVLEYALVDSTASSPLWTSVPVVGHQTILMPLMSDSRYLLRAKSVCGNAYSIYSDTVAFSTSCGTGSHGATLGDWANYVTTEGNHLPLQAYYRYSYTQSLIEAGELGHWAINIDTLRWQYIFSSNETRKIQIYIGETDLAELPNSGVPGNTLTRVFAGTVTFNSDSTWFAIPLQHTFPYSGTRNLVIAVIDSTGSYTSSGNRFATHQTDGYKSVYAYTDGSPYTIGAGYSFSRTNYRPNILFPSNCAAVSCPAPNVIAESITPASATYRLVTMGPLQVQYRAEGSSDYFDLNSQFSPLNSQFVIIPGLLQNTTYELRARTICGVGDTSAWRVVRFSTPLQQQERFYVTTTGAGEMDGSSWANATPNLCWAVSTASSIHQRFNMRPQVWVAEGTYYGDTTATSAFELLAGVDVYGGLQGNEPATFDLATRDYASHPTVLDGQGTRRVLYQPSALSGDSTIWDGFILVNGQAGSDNGGGAYLRQGGILSHSTVTHCRAYYGGGVYNDYGSVRNCTITADSASSGGGVYNYGTVSHCTITANQAYNYGGVRNSGTLSNSLVANNTASDYGGIYNTSTVQGCHVVANLTTSSSTTNYNTSYTTVVNTLFWGNRSQSNPNSLMQVPSSSGDYYNCAFESDIPGGNTSGCIVLSSHNTGALTSPQFIQPAYGAGHEYASGCDWTVQEGSILIDRGLYEEGSSYTSTTDLEGNPRLRGGSIDIGCYESSYSGIELPVYPDSIIYVTPTGAGLRDGTSWANAMDNIGDAVTYSIISGRPRIWVAQGTYHGDTASSGAFTLRQGVNLYGGFVGNEPPTYDLAQRDLAAHATILDGQHAHRVLNQSVNFNTLTVVDGFVIQNGLVTNQSGAGVTLRHGGRLRNCTVQNNIALITNTDSYYGIGVYAAGSSSSDTLLDHCVVRNNSYQSMRPSGYTVYLYGGGMYISNAVVTNCEVYGNSSYYGGGIYLNNGAAYNTVVSHNQAYRYAGVSMSYSHLYNCVVANNTASNNYGGIYSSSSTYIYNSIIWGNKVNYLANNVSGSPHLYHTAVEGGYASGTNVLDLAPTNDGTSGLDNYVRFIDPNQNNYRLHPASHCLDYGDSTYSHLSLDPDGNARIIGNNIDLGAYETSASVTCPSPLNLRSLAITGTTATFAWSPQGSESGWLFTIQSADGTLDSNITLTDTTVTVTGLSLNRNYTCFVRANCGDEYSIRSPQLTITTLCDSSVLTPLSAFTSFQPVDSAIVYNPQVTFSWSALPEATSYDFYLWKGDVEPSTPSVTGLTAATLSNYPLPNYERGAYYHWKVVAWNECINRISSVQTFRVNPYPDLHVTQVACSNPVANQPMTITWTVQNDGEGPTPAGTTWSDYIWISGVDGVGGGFWYDVDEVLLAQVPNLTSLGAGESYTNTMTVTVPEDYIGGYYLFVMTDLYAVRDLNYSVYGLTGSPDPYTPSVTGNPYPYLSGTTRGAQTVEETNDADNFFYKVINILPPPSPDLQVTHISHPINAFSNSDITVGWTVTNVGQAVASPKWVDKVYIQMGNELNLAEAQLLATVPHYAGFDTVRREYLPGPSGSHSGGWVTIPEVLGTPLETDSSYSASATVHIPIQYAGTYNIFVVTDANDAVYESIYETNNEAVSQQTIDIVMSPLADLTVTSVTMPTIVSPRCNYPVSWTVQNVGAAATERAQWRDALYLSSTPTFTPPTAIFLKYEDHNGVIGIDSSYTTTSTITIPATLSGAYYLIVRTDYQDNIFEYTNEDNNERASTAPAQVVLPDLVVSSVQFEHSRSVGDTLHVRAYIKNIGQGTSNGYVKTRFNAGDSWTGMGLQCNLAAGDSLLITRLLKQPCVSTTQGELTIQVDYDNQLQESNENNNTQTTAYTVNRTDLTATAIGYADTGWSGTTMPITIHLSNIGAVPLDDSVALAMYVSTSSISYAATTANRVLDSKEWMHLSADSSIILTKDITLPNGIEGNYYLHLVIDPANKICESNEGNNVTHASTAMYVHLSPYPDLIVRHLEVPDTLSVGQTVSFHYDLINQGIEAASGSLTTKVFMSLGSTYGSAPLIEVATLQQTVSIAVGDTISAIATGMIPTNATAGFYYFFAVTDYANAFYEHTGENNNTVRSALTFVQLYPLDLTIDSISGPATVDWGQRVTYTMTVTNHTAVPTSARQWVDRLYLTQNGAIQANTMNVEQSHTTVLLPGESYQVSFGLTIPFGSPSTLYLVGICDHNRNNPDIDVVNNQLTIPITVNAVPTPDLQVSDVAVLGDVVSGQPFQLAYTVTNVSATSVTEQRWADRVSMSYTTTLNSTSQQLTLNPKEMTLGAGESYRDTINVTVPVPNQGARYLVVQANAQLNFYETVQDNNVVAVPISITLPPPGDLVVSRIPTPDTVVSGRTTTFQWIVANVGANDISGQGLSSLLYLSSDDVFDARDRLLGRTNRGQMTLAAGDTLTEQLAARISGMSEGNYYLIAKTDVRNAFYEDNENNNSIVSTLPFFVKVRELPFNTPLVDTIYNGEPNDYKINVGTHRNETVRIHMESNDSLHGAVNMVYVSCNRVGDNLSYNYSTIGQYTANPELYIPSTRAGYYGVSLYGSLPSNTMQVVTLSADILPFELRSINPTEGGNNGGVTVEMNGSHFRPDMKVWMLRGGDTLFADTLFYSSYYQAFAHFDLTGVDTGYYSMGVLNYCEGEAMLQDVFHVTEASSDGLGYHLVFPNSPRPNRTISMVLEYGNMGNTDIQGAVLEVQSVGGTYIALTPEGLAQQNTTLLLPLSIEGEPEGLLRPGSYGTITIYGYTAGSLVFAIKEAHSN